jgi:hypothetical protein
MEHGDGGDGGATVNSAVCVSGGKKQAALAKLMLAIRAARERSDLELRCDQGGAR